MKKRKRMSEKFLREDFYDLKKKFFKMFERITHFVIIQVEFFSGLYAG